MILGSSLNAISRFQRMDNLQIILVMVYYRVFRNISSGYFIKILYFNFVNFKFSKQRFELSYYFRQLWLQTGVSWYFQSFLIDQQVGCFWKDVIVLLNMGIVNFFFVFFVVIFLVIGFWRMEIVKFFRDFGKLVLMEIVVCWNGIFICQSGDIGSR